MSKLANYLNQRISGNVFDRESICASYTNDRSVLTETPRLVAFPENTEDVRNLTLFIDQLALRDYDLPIVVRGNGTDKTGAAITDGMLILMERMNKIEEIDVRGRLIRVQPGVTLEKLNTALNMQGLCLPIKADPQATIGGLIANCPGDVPARRQDSIMYFVERTEVVLANGEVVQFAPYHVRNIASKIESGTSEGQLYRQIGQILDIHNGAIGECAKRPLDASGYANITRVKHGNYLDLSPLLFSSQGTLGIITDVILRVEVVRPEEHRLVAIVRSEKEFLAVLPQLKVLGPCSLEFYDLEIMDVAAKHGHWPETLERGTGDGWLIIVGFAGRRSHTERNLQRARNLFSTNATVVTENTENASIFARFNSSLLSFLNDGLDGERSPIADDSYIPNDSLERYFSELRTLEMTLGLKLPVFGSYLTANYHIRPEIDCSSLDGRRQVATLLYHYGKLIERCGGSLSGGAPEGRVKAISVNQSYSIEERQLYQAIKDVFDPHHILNPRAKLGAELKDTIRHLRTTVRSGIVQP